MMRLDRDFSAFIACCVARDVQFLIVGGYAVAAHGHPRYTTPADFLEADAVIQLGYPPKRIDVLTSVDGLNFEDCYPDRVTVRIDDVPVPFIDIANLRRNKAAVGRPQDLADLAALERPGVPKHT